jgi:hypothetical protein
MSDADREWEGGPDPPDEDAHEDVAPGSEEGPYLEEPGEGRGLRATGQRGDGNGRSEHDKWRRWAWAALVVLVIGVAWALTLYTILLDRSGDNTAELIALFEEGQQRREAAAGQTSQSQEARRAALEATQAEAQTFRAQTQAARASEAENNASARRALAQAALAGARTNQANAEAARAQDEADSANRQAPSPSGIQRTIDRNLDLQLDRNTDLQRTLERNIDLLRTLETNIGLQGTLDRNRELQRTLTETIEALREAIKDLRSRR